MDNARDFKQNIFISRDCKCAMPYTLSVLRKMLKHVFNSEIKFRLVSDNLCGTVEPRFNEPLFNEVLDITNDIISMSRPKLQ